MRLFYKPKVLKISDVLLKFNTFSFTQNEFSDSLLSKINELFNDYSDEGLKLFINKNTALKDEEFRIDTTPEEIKIFAKTESAAYYGLLTLKEILKQTKNCFYVEDYPDLEIRGVMIDISRTKVPTKETLKDMIKMFSKLRYNHIELYVEGFSFEYKSFPNVLDEKNFITLDDYLELEKYANEYYLDFVPNQNGFGHMADWLAKEEYKDLAECPEGFFIWGAHRPASTLDPINPKSTELVKKMYADMIPHTSSKYFNMNFDEPYELGQGKSKEKADETSVEDVYIEYFNNLAKEVKNYGKIPMLWGDVLIKHPEKLDKLIDDAIFIDWGYDKAYPFEKHAKILSEKKVKYMLAPGTSSWATITSRILDMEHTVLNSAKAAKKYNSLGVLITDWGDMGHLQYLPVSYLGFILGGLNSWTDATLYDAIEYLKQFLNDDYLVEAMLELGRYHLLEGEYRGYGSRLFTAIMWAEHSRRQENTIDFFKTRMFSNLIDEPNLNMLKISFAKAQKLLVFAKESLEKDELLNSLHLLNVLVSVNEKLAKIKNNLSVDFNDEIDELKKYLIKHEQLWLMRNIEYGYKKSADRIVWLIEILNELARKEKLC